MRRPYQIAGLVLTVFALVMLNESLKLPFYTRLGPGPGFFPFWVSLFLAILGVAMAAQATFTPQEPMPEDFFPDRDGAIRIAAILGAFVFLVSTMRWLGFNLSMFMFIVFVLYTLGARRWYAVTLAGLAGSVGVHYAFASWLRIKLPAGVLGL